MQLHRKPKNSQNGTTQTHLTRGNGPAGVIIPYAVHDTRDPAAGVAAPEEVEAGGLDVELVFAGRDGRGHQGHGVEHALVGGGVVEAGVDGLLDAEDEEDEEEGGEELEEGSPLVPPREQQVLPEQGPVLLEQQPESALQLHGRRRRPRALDRFRSRQRFRIDLVVRSKSKLRAFSLSRSFPSFPRGTQCVFITTANGAFRTRKERDGRFEKGSGVGRIYGLCHWVVGM